MALGRGDTTGAGTHMNTEAVLQQLCRDLREDMDREHVEEALRNKRAWRWCRDRGVREARVHRGGRAARDPDGPLAVCAVGGRGKQPDAALWRPGRGLVAPPGPLPSRQPGVC